MEAPGAELVTVRARVHPHTDPRDSQGLLDRRDAASLSDRGARVLEVDVGIETKT